MEYLKKDDVINAMENCSVTIDMFGTKRKVIDGIMMCCAIADMEAIETGLEPEEILDSKLRDNWVPVAERLPDKPGDYWVAMRHLDGSVTTVKMFWNPDWPHEDAWNEVVVAWQPYYYPEPFVPQN